MDLITLIEKERKYLIELGLKKGLSHKETIESSQLLDELLIKYQKYGNININLLDTSKVFSFQKSLE